MHFLNNLASKGESSGEHFCKTMTGIPSGPEALEGSREAMVEETFLDEISMLGSIESVLKRKSAVVD